MKFNQNPFSFQDESCEQRKRHTDMISLICVHFVHVVWRTHRKQSVQSARGPVYSHRKSQNYSLTWKEANQGDKSAGSHKHKLVQMNASQLESKRKSVSETSTQFHTGRWGAGGFGVKPTASQKFRWAFRLNLSLKQESDWDRNPHTLTNTSRAESQMYMHTQICRIK